MLFIDLGNLYSWGRGSHCRLGHEAVAESSSNSTPSTPVGASVNLLEPQIVESIMAKQISLAAGGYWHTIAVVQGSPTTTRVDRAW